MNNPLSKKIDTDPEPEFPPPFEVDPDAGDTQPYEPVDPDEYMAREEAREYMGGMDDDMFAITVLSDVRTVERDGAVWYHASDLANKRGILDDELLRLTLEGLRRMVGGA